MPHYLSAHELGQTAPAELESFESPVPTQVVSNGEYNPLPQTREQRRVEARIKELADDLGPRHGLSRRAFLASSAGMAAAFLAMNDVFGPVFDVSRAEAQQPGVAAQRAGALAGQIAAGRAAINRIADSRRMLAHAVFTPKKSGWMGEVDRAIAELKPDSWKGYTIGDPLFPSKAGSYWRLDDDKLMYPFYEKIVKAGINTVCIHKGLLPLDYEKSWPNVWQYATVDDLGKAAKDWPKINFVIYHSALRAFLEPPTAALAEFDQTGRIKWATDLAEIPGKFGVSNVYGEIGTSFATCAVANPRMAAALMGTLVRGLGADHVLWGSDSVWYGSPQWQIEAMRRLEIPDEMRRKHNFAALGPADGVVKTAIFGGNAARLYRINQRAALGEITRDKVAAIKAEYVAAGGMRSNRRYGYVHRATA